MTGQLYVYLLVSEKTGTPLYAGQGSASRLDKQMQPTYQLRNYGESVKFAFIIGCSDRVEALAKERELIAMSKPLFNKAKWGSCGGLVRSAETRKKMSEAKLNISDETRAKLSASKLGHECSTETRKKIGDALRGRTVTDEARENMSKGMMGRIITDDHREKIKQSITLWHQRRRASAQET